MYIDVSDMHKLASNISSLKLMLFVDISYVICSVQHNTIYAPILNTESSYINKNIRRAALICPYILS